jgi:hypothetical protein
LEADGDSVLVVVSVAEAMERDSSREAEAVDEPDAVVVEDGANDDDTVTENCGALTDEVEDESIEDVFEPLG